MLAETRSLARALGGQNDRQSTWDPDFAASWTELLTAAGRAVANADPAEIAEVRARLEGLVDDASAGTLAENWPIHLGQPPAPLSRIRRGRPARPLP